MITTNDIPALSDAGRDVIAETAGALLGRLDEVVSDIDSALLADVFSSAVQRDELRPTLDESTRAHLSLVLVTMRTWHALPRTAAPWEARDFVRDLVRAGVPKEVLLRLYLRGHMLLSALWHDELGRRVREADLLAETSGAVAAYLHTYVDTIVQPLLDEYVAERELLARRAETIRIEEVRRVLAGETADLQRASARLRYELRRWHLGFVAWAPAGAIEDDVRPQLEAAADLIAQALGAEEQTLVMQGTGLTVHGWIGWSGRRGRAAVTPVIPGLHVALGEQGEGLAGFRRTHEQARLARRVARIAGTRLGASVNYRDLATASLLTADLDQARDFVAQVLGPLGAGDDSSRRLLTTLRVFHEQGGNYARAGRELSVHENTVAYRVRRALELVEDDDPGSLRLRIAVHLACTLGPPDQ